MLNEKFYSIDQLKIEEEIDYKEETNEKRKLLKKFKYDDQILKPSVQLSVPSPYKFRYFYLLYKN